MYEASLSQMNYTLMLECFYSEK